MGKYMMHRNTCKVQDIPVLLILHRAVRMGVTKSTPKKGTNGRGIQRGRVRVGTMGIKNIRRIRWITKTGEINLGKRATDKRAGVADRIQSTERKGDIGMTRNIMTMDIMVEITINPHGITRIMIMEGTIGTDIIIMSIARIDLVDVLNVHRQIKDLDIAMDDIRDNKVNLDLDRVGHRGIARTEENEI